MNHSLYCLFSQQQLHVYVVGIIHHSGVCDFLASITKIMTILFRQNTEQHSEVKSQTSAHGDFLCPALIYSELDSVL